MTPDAVEELLAQLRDSLRVPNPPSPESALAEHGLWTRGLNDYTDEQAEDLIDVVAQRWTRTGQLPAPAQIREWMGERAATRYGHTRQEPEGCRVCGDQGAPWYSGPGRVSLPLPIARAGARVPRRVDGVLEPWDALEIVMVCECSGGGLGVRGVLERWRVEVAADHRERVAKLARLAGVQAEPERHTFARGGLRVVGELCAVPASVPTSSALAVYRLARQQLDRLERAVAALGVRA